MVCHLVSFMNYGKHEKATSLSSVLAQEALLRAPAVRIMITELTLQYTTSNCTKRQKFSQCLPDSVSSLVCIWLQKDRSCHSIVKLKLPESVKFTFAEVESSMGPLQMLSVESFSDACSIFKLKLALNNTNNPVQTNQEVGKI